MPNTNHIAGLVGCSLVVRIVLYSPHNGDTSQHKEIDSGALCDSGMPKRRPIHRMQFKSNIDNKRWWRFFIYPSIHLSIHRQCIQCWGIIIRLNRMHCTLLSAIIIIYLHSQYTGFVSNRRQCCCNRGENANNASVCESKMIQLRVRTTQVREYRVHVANDAPGDRCTDELNRLKKRRAEMARRKKPLIAGASHNTYWNSQAPSQKMCTNTQRRTVSTTPAYINAPSVSSQERMRRARVDVLSCVETSWNEVELCVCAPTIIVNRVCAADRRRASGALDFIQKRIFILLVCAPRRRSRRGRKTAAQKSIPFSRFTIMVYQAIDKLCTLCVARCREFARVNLIAAAAAVADVEISHHTALNRCQRNETRASRVKMRSNIHTTR